MSLHYIYSDAPLSTIDITDRCRVAEDKPLKESAEEGSVPISQIIVDDPDGDLNMTGHRRLYIYEDTAPAGDQVIYYGWTANERVIRGPNRTEAGRQWLIDLADPNVLLSRRIMNGTDANRPAENDFERITALLGMTELDTISDTTFVNASASTVAMDAVDYRGRNVGEYIDDCRKASKKNAYVYYSEGVGGWGLWYDFPQSTEYDSGRRLSNYQDIDNDVTFGYSIERTYLDRDPSRVASGIYLDWEGKPPVYVQDTDTRDEFTAIDFAVSALDVKSSAKATARANGVLNDSDEEDEVIHVVMTNVPREKVNYVKKGQLIQFASSYMPGYEAYVTCRILYRAVTEITEDPIASFEIEMDLTPLPFVCPDATPELTFPRLSATPGAIGPGSHIKSDALGNLQYSRPGFATVEVPTPFWPTGGWHFPAYDRLDVDYAGNCVHNHLRIIVVGDGTLTIPTLGDDEGNHDCLAARWQYRSPAGIITVENQYGVAGDTFTFEIDTEEMAHCVNWVDIEEQTAAEQVITGCSQTCGHGMLGYAGGATWTPA